MSNLHLKILAYFTHFFVSPRGNKIINPLVTSSKVVVKESILKLLGFAETAQRQPTGGIP